MVSDVSDQNLDIGTFLPNKTLFWGLAGFVEYGIKPASFLLGAANTPVVMAVTASDIVTFDMIDGKVLDSGENVLENLTEEEHTEVNSIATLLQSAKENSLDDFENDPNTEHAACHKTLSETKLDRLAGKNSAQATTYQTRWAVIIIKDKY